MLAPGPVDAGPQGRESAPESAGTARRRGRLAVLLLVLACVLLMVPLVLSGKVPGDPGGAAESPVAADWGSGSVSVSRLKVSDDGGQASFTWTVTTDRPTTFAELQLATEGQQGAGFHPGVTVDGSRTFQATQSLAPGSYETRVVYTLDGVEWLRGPAVAYEVTSAAEQDERTAPPASPVEPLPLPAKVVAGYWMKWAESPTGELSAVDPRYNTVLLAFAESSDGSGAVAFDQEVQTDDSFRADVDLLRNRGTRLILSIGGQDGRIELGGPERTKAFVDSVAAVRQQFPFDGIDWDIEGQAIDVEAMHSASLQLQERFGPDFAIMMAPGGHVVEYKELARRLGDTLDFIGIQYYDYPTDSQQQRIDDVKETTAELIADYGRRPDQIGVGMRVFDESSQYTSDGGPSHWFSVEASKRAWLELEALYPALRGAYQWESGTDSRLGGRWIDEVGVLIP